MFEKFFKDEDGNAVLTGIGILVAAVILIALGGLLANSFTNAAALPDGNAFNVSSQTTTNFPIAVTIAYAGILVLIGAPAVALLLYYFGGGMKAGGR